MNSIVILEERSSVLRDLSGMEVRASCHNGKNYFEFLVDGRTVASTFTFKKAKVLAKGMKSARTEIAKRLTPLVSGCSGCDYDEAEGLLVRHCTPCMENLCREVYSFCCENI